MFENENQDEDNVNELDHYKTKQNKIKNPMTFDANHDICLATCDMMVTIYLSWQAKRCTVGVCQTFPFEVVGGGGC